MVNLLFVLTDKSRKMAAKGRTTTENSKALVCTHVLLIKNGIIDLQISISYQSAQTQLHRRISLKFSYIIEKTIMLFILVITRVIKL